MSNNIRMNAAKGRNSFIIYTDSLEILDSLNDEELGELFRTICQYARYLRGKAEEPDEPQDRLLRIAYIPIKNYLQRDWEAYLEACKSKNPNVGKKDSIQTNNEADDYEESG